MDNVNWWLTGIASLIGSIVLSVVGNLLTDTYKNWLAKRSLVSHMKRAEQLLVEADQLIDYIDNPNRFQVFLFLTTFRSMIAGFGAMFTAIYVFVEANSVQRTDSTMQAVLFAIFACIAWFLTVLFLRTILSGINVARRYLNPKKFILETLDVTKRIGGTVPPELAAKVARLSDKP